MQFKRQAQCLWGAAVLAAHGQSSANESFSLLPGKNSCASFVQRAQDTATLPTTSTSTHHNSRFPHVRIPSGVAVHPGVFAAAQVQALNRALGPILALRGVDITVGSAALSSCSDQLAAFPEALTSPWHKHKKRQRSRKTRKQEFVWKQQAPGRFHLQLLHSPVEGALLRVLEGALWPLAAQAVSRDPCTDAPETMQVTEIQLVASHAACDEQTWHVDSSLGGVTLLIPLHDTPLELGPTECVPGTHAVFHNPQSTSANPSSASSLQVARRLYAMPSSSTGCQVLQPGLLSGDCLVMDARTVHRGAKNNSRHGTPRFALIVRYDEWGAHPQSAQSPLVVLAVAQLGRLLCEKCER